MLRNQTLEAAPCNQFDQLLSLQTHCKLWRIADTAPTFQWRRKNREARSSEFKWEAVHHFLVFFFPSWCFSSLCCSYPLRWLKFTTTCYGLWFFNHCRGCGQRFSNKQPLFGNQSWLPYLRTSWNLFFKQINRSGICIFRNLGSFSSRGSFTRLFVWKFFLSATALLVLNSCSFFLNICGIWQTVVVHKQLVKE